MLDARNAIVAWARWSVDHKDWWVYTQDARRWGSVHRPAPSGPTIYCDCSSAVTCWYCWANAPDPNKRQYTGGYTGTLLLAGRRLPAAINCAPADVVVWGPGTGKHAALVVESGSNPLVVSMGHQGDPGLYRVGDITPSVSPVVTYLRFPTHTLRPISPGGSLQPPPQPHPPPPVAHGVYLTYELRGGDHKTTVGPVTDISVTVK